MRKRELVIFIAVTILIVVILLSYVFLSLFSGSSVPKASPTPAPSRQTRSPQPAQTSSFSPSPVPAISSPSPVSSPQLSKNQLIDILPVRTPLFNIEYYYNGDIFRVTIKEEPYSENKSQAEQWFRERGHNSNSLNIFWDAYPEIQR